MFELIRIHAQIYKQALTDLWVVYTLWISDFKSIKSCHFITNMDCVDKNSVDPGQLDSPGSSCSRILHCFQNKILIFEIGMCTMCYQFE